MYGFLKSWVEARKLVNSSYFPDMTTFDSPSRPQLVHSSNADISQIYDPTSKRFSNNQVLSPIAEKISSTKKAYRRNYATQISDLKNENFSLKLRIHEMMEEERMRDRYDDVQEHSWKANIELKVECDSLRKELCEKHDLLLKASNAVACMENQGSGKEEKPPDKIEQDAMQLREIMHEKVQSAESEARVARLQVEQFAQQALELTKQLGDSRTENKVLTEDLLRIKDESERVESNLKSANNTSTVRLLEKDEALSSQERKIDQLSAELREKACTISQLKDSLSSKQTLIELLNDKKRDVAAQQTDLEQLQLKLKNAETELNSTKQREVDAQNAYQDHMIEQQQRLDDFELATKQISEELDKRETEVNDLKDALQEYEKTVEELTDKITLQAEQAEKQQSLNISNITKRDRAITSLTQMIRKKDEEISVLHEDIRDRDARTDELLNSIRKFDTRKHSPEKFAIVQTLRNQLATADEALQAALDDKLRADDENAKRVMELLQKNKEKERQLDRFKAENVAVIRDQAVSDNTAVRSELQKTMQARDEDLEENRRILALKDLEIKQMRHSFRSKEELTESIESQLRFELDNLSRQNCDLREKLRVCEDDLYKLKLASSGCGSGEAQNLYKKRRLLSTCSVLTLWSGQDGAESQSQHKDPENLQQPQLDSTDKDCKKRHKPSFVSNKCVTSPDDETSSDFDPQSNCPTAYNSFENDRRSPRNALCNNEASSLYYPASSDEFSLDSRQQEHVSNLSHPGSDNVGRINRKLKEKLAATKQTVSQQAGELNFCKATLRAAGISCPPLSPVRAAHSVPDLYQSRDTTNQWDLENRDSDRGRTLDRIRSMSADRNLSNIQLHVGDDSGIGSVSPKLEQRFSSLILTQAKELSSRGQQIKISKKICNQLLAEIDVVPLHIISMLISSDQHVDRLLSNNVSEKLKRSKELAMKLRKQLSDNIGIDSQSELNSDTTKIATSSPKISRKAPSLKAKLSDRKCFIDARAQKPSPAQHDSYPHYVNGYLTPAPSRLSSSAEDEEDAKSSCGDASSLPSRLIENDDRYASLPSSMNRARYKGFPLQYSPISTSIATPKSLPMYQSNVTVTEYLPPRMEEDTDSDESGETPHLRITSNTEECSTLFGGAWSPMITPTEVQENHQKHDKNKPSSITTPFGLVDSSRDDKTADKNHKLLREVERLRRRISDIKKLNRSLKEELNSGRNRSYREDNITGVQNSPQNNEELLAQHLNEIRGLRRRLEHSTVKNDKLRDELQKKLTNKQTAGRDYVSASIYLSPEDNVTELQQKLTTTESANKELLERLETEITAREACEVAISDMKLLQQQKIDGCSQTDLSSDDIVQLEQDAEKQALIFERLRVDLSTKDDEISKYKSHLESMQVEMNKVVSGEEDAKQAVLSLSSQLCDCHQLIDSLKTEVAMLEKLQNDHNTKKVSSSLEVTELLEEIRSLRIQLERSIDDNSALRTELEEQLRKAEDQPLTTINIHHLSSDRNSVSSKSPHHGARLKLKLDRFLDDNTFLMTPPPSASSGGEEHRFHFDKNCTSDENTEKKQNLSHPVSTPVEHSVWGKKPSQHPGLNVMCKSKDFLRLQKMLANSSSIAQQTNDQISHMMKYTQKHSPERKNCRDLSTLISFLNRELESGDRVLRCFYPATQSFACAALEESGRTVSFSSSGVASGEPSSSCRSSPVFPQRHMTNSAGEYVLGQETDGLRREVGILRRRLSSQGHILQTTVERINTTNQLKGNLEDAIMKQLSRTHDVLKKARGNLEANVHKPQPSQSAPIES